MSTVSETSIVPETSTVPETPTRGADPSVPNPSKLRDCWSCRVISGGGLFLSGAYVYNTARKSVRGGPTSMWAVAQITFAASLAAMGIVVLIDPVGKMRTKTL